MEWVCLTLTWAFFLFAFISDWKQDKQAYTALCLFFAAITAWLFMNQP